MSGILEQSCLIQFFSEGHKDVLKHLDSFSHILTNLRYEGKLSFGKNIKQAENEMRFFRKVSKAHMKIEEDVVYPFMKKHVPKFDTLVKLLECDHSEINKKIDQLSRLLRAHPRKISDMQKRYWLDEVESAGTYLVYLVREHIRAEMESIFKNIVQHMSHEEIEQVGDEIHRRLRSGAREKK